MIPLEQLHQVISLIPTEQLIHIWLDCRLVSTTVILLVIESIGLELENLLGEIRILNLDYLELSFEVLQLSILHIKFKLVFLNQEFVRFEDAGISEKLCLLQDALFFLLIQVFVLINPFKVELLLRSTSIFIFKSWRV